MQTLEIFTTSQTDSWGRTTEFLNAYSPESYDGRLIGALKNGTKASSRKTKDGRWVWSIASDSRTADAFRAIIAEAAARQ